MADVGTPEFRIDDDTRVLVLTGAGVSAESGIATFRDAGGLWETHAVEDVASPEGFARDPALVWRFYSQRRAAASACVPNAGHEALVALEQRLGDRFLLATQNVDGLHGVAGNERLVELHGNLYRTRCSRCDRAPFADRETYSATTLPACRACDARGEFGLLRPDIVWFGEALDPRHMRRVHEFVHDRRGRLIFVAAGTSGAVYPAAGFVDMCRSAGGETWLVNAESAANASRFHYFVQGRSGEVLPGLFA